MVMEANTETDPAKACRHPAEGGSHADRRRCLCAAALEDLAYGAKKNVDIKPVVNVMNFLIWVTWWSTSKQKRLREGPGRAHGCPAINKTCAKTQAT